MLNHDSSIISFSSKIDSLLDEFAGELILLKSIPLGVDKTDCHPKNEIRLSQRLLYDNSSPRPPKEFNSKNSNDKVESFSPSPIPNEDSDSFMEEINLFLTPEGDIRFLEELLIDDSILSDELFDSNFEENPSILRPPPKPPDVKTDAGEEIAVVMIDKNKFDDDYQIFMFDKVFSLLSAESEDTIFDPGISD
nr:hypothetical protein [Tanacetum cinerariifolium]